VKSVRLDPDQEEAFRADKNVAVSAGAGSGKTTVLAERYIRLATEGGLNVSEILTLTFTRKAAAEMYSRIFKRLAESSDPLAKERLAQFDQARISTLDAFCTAVAKGGSYRYGLSGDFTIDEAELRRTAAETAVEIVMRRRREEPIRRLVASRSFDIVINDLFADAAMTIFSFIQPGNYALQAQKQIDYIKKELKSSIQKTAELCESIIAIQKAKDAKTLEKAQIAARSGLHLKFPETPEDINPLIEIAEYFISKESFQLPGNVKDSALIQLKEAGKELKKEQCPKLYALAKTLLFETDILFIGKIFDEYEKLFLERKRIQGLISFRDAAELAVDILTKDAELRSYYKTHIKAVMIDEFQDNNALQKNLLYLIAERYDAGVSGAATSAADLAGNKLFFVGDEKQSIYRFRGADVAVFRGLAEELGENRRIALSTNYRSAPELVDFFNALFSGVFAGAKESFEAEFAPMQPSPDKKRQSQNAPPRVEAFIQEITDTSSQDDDEDGETAKEIGEALSAAKRIALGVKQGEFGFGDVAVLFRSTTHQNQYERVFRQVGIPFCAADPRGIFSEAPANDFYAALRLSLFPQDSNAYATVLRSPFAGLSDETVFAILLDKPDEPFCENPPASWFPNSAERERYYRGQAVFSHLRNIIDLSGIAPGLAYLWYETGYRTYLLYTKERQSYLEHFEYLYALALEADQMGLTLGAFLDALASRMGTSDKIETGDVPALKDQVLFITVHKSKGLEFPVVIIANAGAESKGPRNDKPYFYDSDEFGLIVNIKSDTAKRNEKQINYFYELRKEHELLQEKAELKRLFYVAATRAKDKLIIIGSRKVTKKEEENLIDLEPHERLECLMKTPRKNGDDETRMKSFLDLLSIGLSGTSAALYRLIPMESPGFQEYAWEIQTLRERIEALRGLIPGYDSPEKFYARSRCASAPNRSISVSPTQLEELAGHSGAGDSLPVFDSDTVLDKYKDADEENKMHRTFGTLCHTMIEMLFDGDVRPETAYYEAHRLFRQTDMSDGEIKIIAAEALALARRFLDSPYGRQAAISPRRQTEFPFILPLKASAENTSILIHGAIDLVYEHEGRCVIIDFKTDRAFNPSAHRVQLACYRYAVKAFSDLPAETLLVYLRNMQALSVDIALPISELCALALSARADA
jgi:ATP-dependent helicase/nuclease subunit A